MKLSERTYQVTVGVLILIILFLGYLLYKGNAAARMGVQASTTSETSDMGTTANSQLDNTSGATAGSSSTAVSSSGSESVMVADQPAGTSVAVSSVTLSQPGWVAVRDTSGRTLGAAWFDAGTHTGVVVPLLRATTVGQSYQALLYADNGDHQFDLHSDALITNADGSVAGTTFNVK
jgi:hypothetical protein